MKYTYRVVPLIKEQNDAILAKRDWTAEDFEALLNRWAETGWEFHRFVDNISSLEDYVMPVVVFRAPTGS